MVRDHWSPTASDVSTDAKASLFTAFLADRLTGSRTQWVIKARHALTLLLGFHRPDSQFRDSVFNPLHHDEPLAVIGERLTLFGNGL